MKITFFVVFNVWIVVLLNIEPTFYEATFMRVIVLSVGVDGCGDSF